MIFPLSLEDVVPSAMETSLESLLGEALGYCVAGRTLPLRGVLLCHGGCGSLILSISRGHE